MSASAAWRPDTMAHRLDGALQQKLKEYIERAVKLKTDFALISNLL
jgi:hypothetical protein